MIIIFLWGVCFLNNLKVVALDDNVIPDGVRNFKLRDEISNIKSVDNC